MIDWMRQGMVVAALVGGLTALASAQVLERNTTVTGPRGRSIERDVRIQRGPGSAERDITIQRPGGTIQRDVRIQRGPGGFERDISIQRPGGGFQRETRIERIPGGGFGPGWGPAYGYRPWWPGYYAPRPVIGVPFAFGIGAPLFSFAFGAPAIPPPVVVPPPVVAAPPVAAAAPAVAAGTGSPGAGPAFDAFGDAYGRLGSHHANSRRDGALTLGRLRDPRALPGLVDRMEKDSDKHVRIASAWALGEIGDGRAALPLQRVALYDKKQDVRQAASDAYRHLPPAGAEGAPGETPAPAPANAPTEPGDSLVPPPEMAAPTSAAPISVLRSTPAGRRPAPVPADRNTPPPPPQPAPGFGDNS